MVGSNCLNIEELCFKHIISEFNININVPTMYMQIAWIHYCQLCDSCYPSVFLCSQGKSMAVNYLWLFLYVSWNKLTLVSGIKLQIIFACRGRGFFQYKKYVMSKSWQTFHQKRKIRRICTRKKIPNFIQVNSKMCQEKPLVPCMCHTSKECGFIQGNT
jgi:hypothetical protein